MNSTRSALQAVLACAVVVSCLEAVAESPRLPRPLKEAGFKESLDDGLAAARKEDKLVLLYLVPTWFDAQGCRTLEEKVFATREFREQARAFVPVRVAVEPESELLARTWVDRFPSVRILGPDGFMVAGPKELTVAAMVSAVDAGKKQRDELVRYFASADLSKPQVRAAVIEKHAERGDFASARALYDGFGQEGASAARLRGLLVVSDCLLRSRRFEDMKTLLGDAERTFTTEEARPKLADLRARFLLVQIEVAAAKKDRQRALSLLDEFVAKYPEHPAAKHAEDTRKRIIDLK